MTEKAAPIREIIAENISLSTFAKCMGVSRPTLYKYMDAYDEKNLDIVPDSILKVFDTISSRIPKDRLQAYFNELYANYIRTEERRMRESPVPPDIAEIVDIEGLQVKDVDNMIERAQRHLDRLLRKSPVDEDEVESVRKDIRDLEYTRDMVERRQSENRFLLIDNACWTVCTGPDESDVMDYDEDAEEDVPGIDTKFRFLMTRAVSGFTLFFFNDREGDSVELQLLTGPRDDRMTDVVGVFHPEPGMKFIRILGLFDEGYEEFFQYRVIRSNDGNVLNSAIGSFDV